MCDEDVCMKDLVSIIVPVFNREKTLERLFSSFKRLDYFPLEIIFVDNGSSDSSWSLCEDFQAATSSVDFQIKLIKEDVRGASRARNAGLAIANGTYVSFFDSDDEMSPDFISSMVNALKADACAEVVIAKSRMVFENGMSKVRAGWINATVADHILTSMVSTQSFVCRRDFLNRIGGWNDQLAVWVDYELGVRILLYAKRIVWIDRVFHRIHQHSESITGTSYSARSVAILKALGVITETLYMNIQDNYMSNLRALHLRERIISGQFIREGDRETSKKVDQMACAIEVGKFTSFWGGFLRWYVSIGGRGAWRMAVSII